MNGALFPVLACMPQCVDSSQARMPYWSHQHRHRGKAPMSIATDRADADTLEIIGRHPGSKRSDTFIVKAAVARLILAGQVAQPNTTGRLYLTEAGTERVWQPAPRAVLGHGGS